MANFSFDIVSEVDLQEVDNALNQARKEVVQRYDFKNSKCSIDFDRKEKKIKLIGDNDYKLRALIDIINTRMVKRGISLKSLSYGDPQKGFEGTLHQEIGISTGIEKEKAKDLIKIIKGLHLKVQAQIENEKIRVSAAKKDDLQTVIAHLRGIDFPLPLAFTNYR